jgi:2'-5' RNA ligase
LTGLTQFQNEKYDVVKFDVEKNEILSEIRRRCDCYKNEDKYPDYKPHMTLAYVQKGRFPHIKEGLNLSVPVTRFKYSGQNGKKLYINL